jgi:hypothetical protein
MLSQQATKETKASVFGFHRAMDTVGAAIGPIIALVFLYFFQKIIHRYFISHSFPVSLRCC